jgi:hypothetical protein
MDKSPRVKENPVAPVFQNRWYRFLSAAQDIPVTYPVKVTPSPIYPLSHPRLRTGKGEAREAISWRFEDSTVGFKVWRKISVPQLGGIGFPSIQGLQQLFHHVDRYPMSWFCPIYFSRDYLLDSFGRMASIWS